MIVNPEYKLMQLALRNARSHHPITKLTAETQAKLEDEIFIMGMEGTKRRDWQCRELLYLTEIILEDNGYTGRQRRFCSKGLNCNCDIPCGA